MKIYFASDFHLGMPNLAESRQREKLIVKWLDEIREDCTELYLMGDLFDFWFEYKTVVPKGYVRLLGKIAEYTDAGIPVHVFIGNHDMWMFGYLEEELGVEIHRKNLIREFSGKTFFLGHGDGIGPGDYGYKFIKAVFANKVCQWLFARIHPNLAFALANFWSRRSRVDTRNLRFLGEENEHQIIFAKQQIKKTHFDYFIFGHRHVPNDIALSDSSRYINLGDWIINNTYAVFDGETLQLKKYE
ncbi:MAG TPA: UDP-2,3-diacylglucosamine diphosphatase [Flavobacteriales bacterium]|nr:UDP-2,3-diacylglucosamine diphosphatase [Flavobacteriales bacterium]HIO67256.1 UDP-2,3-diacylglucosamine diphosphatase [Flavobacteriales bacterium]